MTALSQYLNAQLGPPGVSGLGEAEIAALDEMGAIRLPPWMQGRRRREGGGGGGGSLQAQLRQVIRALQAQGIAGEDLGEDLDLGGEEDDIAGDLDLAGEDAEIDGLGEDDDDAVGADGREDVGASVDGISNRIDKLQAKLLRLQARLDATPTWKRRRRTKLAKMIAKVRATIGKKEAKRQRKLGILAAKLGVPVAALAAGYVAGSRVQEATGELRQAQVQRAYNRTGTFGRSVPQGEEQRVAFQDAATGSQVVVIAVAAGAGLRTAAISMITPVISYARFKVIGLDAKLQAVQGQGPGAGALASEILINCLLTNVTVGGGYNLLYTTEDVAFGAQVVGGQLSNARTIPSLRGNPVLDNNNTATLTATFRQEITTTVTLSATFSAALVCEVLDDSSVRAFAS